MMTQCFFTVIIPAFNAERYLPKAIESVLAQSFENFEMIIVNDGSKDRTSAVAHEYAFNDDRILVVDKANAGVAAARNTALRIARGKYILFLDADDIIYPNSLLKIFDELNEFPYDFLRFEYQTIGEKEQPLFPNYEARKRKKWERKNLDSASCIRHIVRSEFFSCVGVYKREIIEINQLAYMDGCTYNEDTLFMIDFFLCSATHIYISDVVYGYRKVSSAVTAKFTDKNFEDVENVIVEILHLNASLTGDMNFVLKQTIEMLCLRLFLHNKKKTQLDIPDVIAYCKKNAVLKEWNVINLFGADLALSIFPFINIFKRGTRKVVYFISKFFTISNN